jgi:hypothetical protein
MSAIRRGPPVSIFGEFLAASWQLRPLSGSVYVPGGYRRWHTNAFGTLGWRMYLVDVPTAGGSFFRYFSSARGRVVTILDEPRSALFFEITQRSPLWHCVGAPKKHAVEKGLQLASRLARSSRPDSTMGLDPPRRVIAPAPAGDPSRGSKYFSVTMYADALVRRGSYALRSTIRIGALSLVAEWRSRSHCHHTSSVAVIVRRSAFNGR